MNTDEKQYEDRIEEANRAFSGALPRVVNDFIDAAVEVSHRNNIPAGLCFFNILGQVVKDFIIIPSGQGRGGSSRRRRERNRHGNPKLC